MSKKPGSVFGGAMLVAGTAIGGGMLALPVQSALGGFLPAIVIHLLCWACMTATALLILEVCLRTGKGSNIMTMADQTLGFAGKSFSAVLYLFLFGTLTTAYVVEGGNLTFMVLEDHIPQWASSWVFVFVFAPFVFIGARAVDGVNKVAMLGLIAAYAMFFVLGIQHVNFDFIEHIDWRKSLLGMPLAFTSFAFQGLVPSLTAYMQQDAARVKKAIIVGSFISLVIYAVWEVLTMGIIPTFGERSLADALSRGQSVIMPLKKALTDPTVIIVGQFFAFFAVLSSFLGVTLGLRDFLADGFAVDKDVKGKTLLCMVIFLPPIGISMINPNLFLRSLNYAGGFGCALLLGLLPIVMTWVGRYKHERVSPYQLKGGRFALILLTLFIIFEVAVEIANELGMI